MAPRLAVLTTFALSVLSNASGSHAFCSPPVRRAAPGPVKTEFTAKTPMLRHGDSIRSKHFHTSLSMRNGNEVQGTDRIVSCIPYLLPLMDGDSYGRFLFATLPPLGLLDGLLLGPFKLIYFAIPFSQFLCFIGLSFLSRNPEISRSIRFNMQQALILDILLIFPSLFGRLGGIGLGMPRILIEAGSNFVFYALVLAVGYSLYSNLTGKVPNQIPLISEATEMQIGPF